MPVVATDVGSVAGMLSGYEDGFLVKPGDERGLASALQRALDRVSTPGFARGSTPDGVLAQHPVAVARATLAAYGEVEMQSLERSERRRWGSVYRE